MYTPWHIGRIDASPAVLDVVTRRIGSSFAGDILRILASHKGCLESFWQSISLSFETNHIQYAAARLRNGIDMGISPCADHLSYLAGRYSREQARQIKYVVEVFYVLEPVFAILATLAQRWIARQFCFDTPASDHVSHCDDSDIPMCLGEIDFQSIEAPHLFYSALAKWPDYAAMVRNEIENTCDFAEHASLAVREAQSLSEDITLSAPESAYCIDKGVMTRSIEQSSEMSAKVMVTATMLRKGFLIHEGGEREKRR
ncbi:MAG: hypothetical protein ABFD83_01150 [Armatimonadota bacterium]